MGRTADYTYANYENITDYLANIVVPGEMNTTGVSLDPDEVLSTITDEEINEKLQEQIKIINGLADDIYLASNREGEEKHDAVENILKKLKKINLEGVLQEYREKTNYEFVRDENYAELCDVSEKISKLKVSAEYIRAEAKERQILEEYSARKESFNAKMKDYLKNEISSEDIKKETAKYTEEIENEKQKLEDFKKARAEKLEKDLAQDKEFYGYMMEFEKEKNKIQKNMKTLDPNGDYKERMEENKKELENVENKIKQLNDKRESLLATEKELAIPILRLGDDIKKYKKLQDSYTKSEQEGITKEQLESINSEIQSVGQSIMEFALSNGISAETVTKCIEHMVEYDDFNEKYKQEMKPLSDKKESLKETEKKLADTAYKMESCKEDFRYMLRRRETVYISEKHMTAEEYNQYANDGIPQEVIDAYAISVKDKIDSFEKKANEDILRAEEICNKKIEELNKKIENVEKEYTVKQEQTRTKIADAYVQMRKSGLDDAMELEQNKREFQKIMLNQFNDFNKTILGGTKDKDRKNSVEFENMKTALGNLSGLANGKEIISEDKYQKTIEEVREAAQKYLKAKEKQIRLFPSTQRVARMEYTKRLITHCNNMLGIDYGMKNLETAESAENLKNKGFAFYRNNKVVFEKNPGEKTYMDKVKELFKTFYDKVKGKTEKVKTQETPTVQKIVDKKLKLEKEEPMLQVPHLQK